MTSRSRPRLPARLRLARSLGLVASAAGLALAAPLLAQEAGTPQVIATAQVSDAATLTADQVTLSGQTLTASGDVLVTYKGNRLSARSVTYDGATGALDIEGPLKLVEPNASGAILVADQAHLSRDLQNGVLTGARLVLARELQIAASRIERRDGRYTVLERTVASSCEICTTDPTPLWEIRARRITHDSETRQLTFEGAQFRVMGAPLAYIPSLRLPDPTVERMSGVLTPHFTTSSTLGFGLALPYFQTLGESRDLTITPFLATKNAKMVSARYREAYATGQLAVAGAVARDEVLAGETRGYVFADGTWELPRGYTLGLQIRTVSDDAVLVDYDVTDDDRLWSGVTLERVRADRMVWGRVGNTHSIREGESNSTEPMLAGDVQAARLYGIGGGLGAFEWTLHGHRRASDTDGIEGRDLARATAAVDWQRNWLLGSALVNLETRLDADFYAVAEDPAFEGYTGRLTPTAALTLRWPLVRQTGSASEVLEPIVQLVAAPSAKRYVPNEDSLLSEFDEGNLWSISRYPGEDAREGGLRANLGASWTRIDASGWSLGITGGRVLRANADEVFGASTGLTGASSDWLLASHIRSSDGLILSNRALIDDSGTLARDELRAGWVQGARALSLGYLWIEADATESRNEAISELFLDTQMPVNPFWTASLDTRYDYTNDRAARATLGLGFQNECLSVDLALSRRFTSSSSVTPETRLSVDVALAGFGGGARGPSGSCMR